MILGMNMIIEDKESWKNQECDSSDLMIGRSKIISSVYFWNFSKKSRNLKNKKNIPPAPFKGGVRNVTLIICWIAFFSIITPIGCITGQESDNKNIIVGAERTEIYFPLVKGKRIGIVANQTSLIGEIHLVDSLLNAGFNVVKAFGPEHGFRGDAGAGEEIKSNVDSKTGIPVVSLYGKNKKPTPEDLAGIEIMIFDIQDVGARFYTYISTMTYVMQACAENNIPLIILDRPNPHGDYVDGPVLEPAYASFVGLHPVPVVYGMTMGEYAMMVNGEFWLKDSIQCDVKVVTLENYDHKSRYELPVLPSPNLPNNVAIQLYPSLCFFEGTIMSVGRGTEFPFQVIGHPDFLLGSFVFTPEDIPDKAMNPPHEGRPCYGFNLSEYESNAVQKDRKLNLFYLLEMYRYFESKGEFFNSFFDKLAGTDRLRKQIEAGETEEMIRQSWQNELNDFKKLRKKYLLYPDFE